MKVLKWVPFVLLALLALFFWQGRQEAPPKGTLQLVPPGFVGAAAAEGEAGAALETVTAEAGMSAYFKADSTIDLNQVEPAFRTVEDKTADYIVGSVPVPGYAESYDVHAYVDVNGWILAYYPQAEGRSVGDTVDWLLYYDSGDTVLTTKLAVVVQALADQAGVTYGGSTHYHFRYPSATDIAVLIERTSASGNFEFSIPGEWTYLERSYSLAWRAASDATQTVMTFLLDGNVVYTHTDEQNWHDYAATLGTTKVPPDEMHEVSITGEGTDVVYGSIVLLYQVP